MRALAAGLSRQHTLFFALVGLFLLCCSVSSSQAAIVVEDSPLYRLTLVSALSDLTDDPTTATTRWGVDGAGRLVEDFFVTPAYAQEPTVGPGAPLCATHFQENTICEQSEGDKTKKYTQCDKSTGNEQVCHFTVHAPKKTNCFGETNHTVCQPKGPDNRSGTRCPGDDPNRNECTTNSPQNFTDCKKEDVATLCFGETSKCRPGDRNICHTFGAPNEKTQCLSGKTVATLCKKEATACSQTESPKNICKVTTKAGNKLTGCPSTNHVTLCALYPPGETECEGDRLRQGCRFANVSLGPRGHVPDGEDVLVWAETAEPFWGDADSTATLIFGTPGPVITDVTIFDSTSAVFYFDFPTEQYQQVWLDNGTVQMETAGLLIAWWTVPAMDWLGIAMLLALLAVAGTLIRRWRARQEA